MRLFGSPKRAISEIKLEYDELPDIRGGMISDKEVPPSPYGTPQKLGERALLDNNTTQNSDDLPDIRGIMTTDTDAPPSPYSQNLSE